MALNEVTIMGNQVEEARIGHQAVSLTHYDDTLECEIAQGAVIEVGGALYLAAANEPITGWAGIAADNDVYIKLTVAGASVTASFTLTAPTWDTAKQGWYIGGTERVIGGLYKDAGGNYTKKYLYHFVASNSLKIFGDGTIGIWDGLEFISKKVLEIGDWNMDSTITLNIAHGLIMSKIRSVYVSIIDDNGSTIHKLDFDNSTGVSGYYYATAANIYLARITGSFYDTINFDLTPYNRGWITIEHAV